MLINHVTDTTINLLMILAMFVGFFQIRQLEFMKDEGKKSTDKIIIITAFGMFAYSTYTIIAGSLNNRNIQEPRELIVVNGIVELIQVRKVSQKLIPIVLSISYLFSLLFPFYLEAEKKFDFVYICGLLCLFFVDHSMTQLFQETCK